MTSWRGGNPRPGASAPRRLPGGGILAAGAFVGGVTMLGLVTAAEAVLARGQLIRRAVPTTMGVSGNYGSQYSGPALGLTMLGDSLAVGMGADTPDDTVGVGLARGLAVAARRPVALENVAVVGAKSSELDAQIDMLVARGGRPDVAVVVIGGNEILHLHRLGASTGYLAAAVRRLRGLGAHVIVATCPDMGTVRPFVQPLRRLAHALSRLLATAQTIVALREGARTVSLADTVGPVFRARPAAMFSSDRLHPSSRGYAQAVEAILPSVCAAAGYRPIRGIRTPHRVYSGRPRGPLLVWFAFRVSRFAGQTASARHRASDQPRTPIARAR